jgi:hypothetical protein
MTPTKETRAPIREPLFIRFLNKELSAVDMLHIFARSPDPYTAQTASKAMDDPPNLEEFHQELLDAVRDLTKTGLGEEFKAFVNNYMGQSLIEDVESKDSKFGENVSRRARIVDEESPWVQGLICYNLCLYIKAFGLEDLKICRICHKLFAHKGKYAIYCSDACKKSPAAKLKVPETRPSIPKSQSNQGTSFSDMMKPISHKKK